MLSRVLTKESPDFMHVNDIVCMKYRQGATEPEGLCGERMGR